MTPALELWNGVASTTGATTTGLLPLVYILGGTLIALFFLFLLGKTFITLIKWLFGWA